MEPIIRISFLCISLTIVSYSINIFQSGTHELSHSANANVLDNCERFLDPILAMREKCLNDYAGNVVEICVNFVTDVEYLIPFIVHHLSIGAYLIHIYNNDAILPWYFHPTILCFVKAKVIVIQPWPGDGVGLHGYNHCQKDILRRFRRHVTAWQSVVDIDEFIVLKKSNCLASLLSEVTGPGVNIDWAMFIPNLTATASEIAEFPSSLNILPPEKLVYRLQYVPLAKTIARVNCIKNWPDPHFPQYYSNCSYGTRSVTTRNEIRRRDDPFIREITQKNMEVAQINHYWTLSIKHFLRKMHRGRGSQRSNFKGENYRSTEQLFQLSTQKTIMDSSFVDIYGSSFERLKQICLQCFNNSYYYN